MVKTVLLNPSDISPEFIAAHEDFKRLIYGIWKEGKPLVLASEDCEHVDTFVQFANSKDDSLWLKKCFELPLTPEEICYVAMRAFYNKKISTTIFEEILHYYGMVSELGKDNVAIIDLDALNDDQKNNLFGYMRNVSFLKDVPKPQRFIYCLTLSSDWIKKDEDSRVSNPAIKVKLESIAAGIGRFHVGISENNIFEKTMFSGIVGKQLLLTSSGIFDAQFPKPKDYEGILPCAVIGNYAAEELRRLQVQSYRIVQYPYPGYRCPDVADGYSTWKLSAVFTAHDIYHIHFLRYIPAIYVQMICAFAIDLYKNSSNPNKDKLYEKLIDMEWSYYYATWLQESFLEKNYILNELKQVETRVQEYKIGATTSNNSLLVQSPFIAMLDFLKRLSFQASPEIREENQELINLMFEHIKLYVTDKENFNNEPYLYILAKNMVDNYPYIDTNVEHLSLYWLPPQPASHYSNQPT